jgi:hypothetical protein
MKRLVLSGRMPSPSTSANNAYEEIFSGEHAHMQALRELFAADDEVHARKQRHHRSATWA